MFPLRITNLDQLAELYWMHDAQVQDVHYVHDDATDAKDLLVSCVTGIENDPPELDERKLLIRFDVADIVVGALFAYRPGLDQIDGLGPSKSEVLREYLEGNTHSEYRAPALSVAIWFVSGSQLDIACDSITISEKSEIQ